MGIHSSHCRPLLFGCSCWVVQSFPSGLILTDFLVDVSAAKKLFVVVVVVVVGVVLCLMVLSHF